MNYFGIFADALLFLGVPLAAFLHERLQSRRDDLSPGAGFGQVSTRDSEDNPDPQLEIDPASCDGAHSLGARLAEHLIDHIDVILLLAPAIWRRSRRNVIVELDYRVMRIGEQEPGMHFWAIYIGNGEFSHEVIEGEATEVSRAIDRIFQPLFQEANCPDVEPAIYQDLFCNGALPIRIEPRPRVAISLTTPRDPK